jgi:O-antigen/teichoic acid export membrane protein
VEAEPESREGPLLGPAAGRLDMLDDGSAGGMAIRGSALRVGSFLAQLALSLVAVPLMVRHLGPDDYGRYVTVSSIVFIISGFTEGGLMYLGIRHYVALRGEERERLLRNLTGLRLVLTVLGVIGAVLFTWLTGAASVVVLGSAIVGVGMLLLLVQATYTIPLQAQLRFGTLSFVDLLKQFVLTSGIVLFVATDAGLVPFFWTTVFSGAAVLVATLWFVRREVATLLPAFELHVWRRFAHEVLPYGLAAAVGLIYFRLAVVIMSYVATPYETGIYSTAFRMVEVLAGIPWLAVSTGFPILVHAKDDTTRMRDALQPMFEVAMIVGVGFALVIALIAPFAIKVVAGAAFVDAVPVLRLLGVALVTSFLVATWSFALLSLARYRQLLVANAIGAIVVAGATFALQPSLGARGAAIATLVGEATLAFAYVVLLTRTDRKLLPRFAFLWKIALAAAAGALVALTSAPAVLVAIAGGAIYVALLFALRAVPMELVRAFARRGS